MKTSEGHQLGKITKGFGFYTSSCSCMEWAARAGSIARLEQSYDDHIRLTTARRMS